MNISIAHVSFLHFLHITAHHLISSHLTHFSFLFFPASASKKTKKRTIPDEDVESIASDDEGVAKQGELFFLVQLSFSSTSEFSAVFDLQHPEQTHPFFLEVPLLTPHVVRYKIALEVEKQSSNNPGSAVDKIWVCSCLSCCCCCCCCCCLLLLLLLVVVVVVVACCCCLLLLLVCCLLLLVVACCCLLLLLVVACCCLLLLVVAVVVVACCCCLLLLVVQYGVLFAFFLFLFHQGWSWCCKWTADGNIFFKQNA